MRTEQLEDVTPHTLEAERAVLGAVLADADRLLDVLDVITPGQFFRQAHGQVFTAYLALQDAGTPIDALTVTAWLRQHGTLEAVGGPSYLASLMDGVPRSTNARTYAQQVAHAARLRVLEQAGHRIVALARQADDDASERAEQLLFELTRGNGTRSEFLDGPALAQQTYAAVERMAETKRHVTGVPSGFPDFDELTRGFQPGALVILAARPSMGKTSLALNAAFFAAEAGHHTAFFSLEMSSEELGLRLVASIARLDAYRIQSGYINQGDYSRLSDAISRMEHSFLHVLDDGMVSLLDVRAKGRRLQAQHGLGLIVVDYLQLMHLPRAENRNVAVAEVSRGLKIVARELKVPVLVLSQLSRESERRGGDKKPQLSDLRDSGAIEQDADLVVFIHRPEVYEPTPENTGLAELIISKQRNGPTGTVRLQWHREQTRFDSRTA